MIIKAALPISILFGASILTYSSAGQHPRLFSIILNLKDYDFCEYVKFWAILWKSDILLITA